MIPINGFTHLLLLRRLGLENIYEEKFEKPLFMVSPERQIESNPDVAKFFWNEEEFFPAIDDLNERLSKDSMSEEVCPIKISIGAILFEREFWMEMGYFPVNRSETDLGNDEYSICCACMGFSRPVMVSKNIVVGHLSFGLQNEAMRQYYMQHPEVFTIKEVLK